MASQKFPPAALQRFSGVSTYDMQALTLKKHRALQDKILGWPSHKFLRMHFF